MKKARIALIAAGVAVILLAILYVTATGTVFSPLAAKLIMTLSFCLIEAAAVIRIIDDHKSGKPLTTGIIIAAAIAIIAISGFGEG